MQIVNNGWSQWSEKSKFKVSNTTGIDDYKKFPHPIVLDQNYPNPFNPTTTIGFGIVEKGNVKLSVINLLGEEIKILLNKEMEAGYHFSRF